VHALRLGASGILALITAIALAACASNPPERGRAVRPPVIRDIPSALRGTVGSETTLTRANAVLVSGYGLVVGLPGTGGGDLDDRIAATMERQLGLMGVSRAAAELEGTPFEGMTPRQILRSKDVAVVIVYSAIVPGAPEGTIFDVFVRAASPSPDISLEGGLLWTTDLQIGPPAPVGGFNKRRIGTAYGPIFINPFAHDAGTPDGYGRNIGRILGGGTVTGPLPLQLVMDNESHQRARAITRAINNRFPQQPGDDPTARGSMGRSADEAIGIININVPAAFRERSSEFLNLLLHVQVEDSVPHEFARRYVEALKSEPYLADDMRWCLQALPQKSALAFLRDLYDHPEERVRINALRAGAGLADALAAPHLKRLARDGSRDQRIEAIELMARLSAGPMVDVAIQEQLEAPELSVRIAAYEALADRAETIQMERLRVYARSLPAASRVTASQARFDPRTQMEIPGDNLQGVRRRVIDRKFLLDTVRGGEPMIYVTQSGRPRIVLFGDDLRLQKPALVSAWGDRLMLVCDSPTDDFRILYRTPDRRSIDGDVIPGRTMTGKAPGTIPDLIEFLAHSPSPEDPRPGLGMTYSEVVGALHAFQTGRAIDAAFAIEEDVLRARIQSALESPEAEDRPETTIEAESRDKVRIFESLKPDARPAEPAPPRSLIVPLPPPEQKKK
jgi:hypothetical protein